MILTAAEARAFIAGKYGAEFKFRLTARCTIGVRPCSDPRPCLAWRKLVADRKGDIPSAVYIGRLLPNLTIDWEYQP